jgi:hypothetical protein
VRPSTFNYATILDVVLVDPIAALAEQLLRTAAPEANDTHTSARECGLSSALCLLLVLFLESAVMRLRHERHAAAGERSALAYVRRQCQAGDLAARVTEIFVLRDVVAHNHLWEVTASTDPLKYGATISKGLANISGDAKYRAVVAPGTCTTRVLGLHVIPWRIDRTDAQKTLRTVWSTLQCLRPDEADFRARVALINVGHRGDVISFEEFVSLFAPAVN